MTKRLLNIPEVATILGRSPGAIRELIWKGKIPFIRLDRRIQVDAKDLEEVIQKNKRQFTY